MNLRCFRSATRMRSSHAEEDEKWEIEPSYDEGDDKLSVFSSSKLGMDLGSRDSDNKEGEVVPEEVEVIPEEAKPKVDDEGPIQYGVPPLLKVGIRSTSLLFSSCLFSSLFTCLFSLHLLSLPFLSSLLSTSCL